MRPVPRHLAPEGRADRLLTQTAILVSLVALAGYLGWRVTSTLSGVHLPLAVGLLCIDIWFAIRHAVLVLPALLLRIGGQVADPTEVPKVDVLIVIRDESLRVLRVSLKSGLEVRGRTGLAAVNLHGRPEAEALCRQLGVAIVDPAKMPQLGAEDGRVAQLLALVPAASWVSADVGVMAGPAFASADIGAVSFANTTHGLVWLVGTRGYLPPVFGDDRLAARLDTAGVPSGQSGPVVCRKNALRSVGGVCWDARDPILATQHRLAAGGWRMRCANSPGSYRMAPASEALALRERVARFADWADARRHLGDLTAVAEPSRTQRFWRGFVAFSAQVERWSVVGRLGALAIPMVALAAGALPAQVRPRELLLYGGLWVVSGMMARRLAGGRRQAGVENARVGFRAVGADLSALVGTATTRPARRHATVQNLVMGALLVAMMATVWTTVSGRFGGPDAFERFAMLVALLAVPALIRDAAVAYRQQRLLPRVSYASRGRGDVLEISPEGLDVDGALPLGSTQAVELALPLAGQRLVRRVVPAKVMAHRRRGSTTESYLRMYPDDDLATELAYFCGVTAPTMRWHGVEPHVARPLPVLDERLLVPGAASSGPM